MRFAKIVFWVAGIWGLLVLTPLYFMFDLIGRNDPPPITLRGTRPGVAGGLYHHRNRPGALSAFNDSVHPRKSQLGRIGNRPRLARPNAQVGPGLCGD